MCYALTVNAFLNCIPFRFKYHRATIVGNRQKFGLR